MNIDGRIVFREETIIDNSRETETETRTSINESETSQKKTVERPAVKKWQIMAAYQLPGTVWAGAGFRQSLWIIESSVWVMNPLPVNQAPEFKPMVGLSIAF